MERIFTSRDGNVEVSYFSVGFHGGDREPRQTSGWREKHDGTRELVHWKSGQWIDNTEINAARVAARTF